MKKLWIPESRKMTVCIDSYREGIFQGRLSDRGGSIRSFQSLSQFLVMVDQLLEQAEGPQSDTARRSFSACLIQPCETIHRGGIPRGAQATFELQILFRQQLRPCVPAPPNAPGTVPDPVGHWLQKPSLNDKNPANWLRESPRRA